MFCECKNRKTRRLSRATGDFGFGSFNVKMNQSIRQTTRPSVDGELKIDWSSFEDKHQL